MKKTAKSTRPSLANKQAIVTKSHLWPDSFLVSQTTRLVRELRKYENWHKSTKKNLLETERPIATNGNEGDCARYFTDLQVDDISADTSTRIIQKIRNALDLIMDDLLNKVSHTYGICSNERCGSIINTKRLKAVPWADLCVKCQKNTEEAIAKSYANNGAGKQQRDYREGITRSRSVAAGATRLVATSLLRGA